MTPSVISAARVCLPLGERKPCQVQAKEQSRAERGRLEPRIIGTDCQRYSSHYSCRVDIRELRGVSLSYIRVVIKEEAGARGSEACLLTCCTAFFLSNHEVGCAKGPNRRMGAHKGISIL